MPGSSLAKGREDSILRGQCLRDAFSRALGPGSFRHQFRLFAANREENLTAVLYAAFSALKKESQNQ